MQNSTFGESCANRSSTPRSPKSGEQHAQMAPIAVVASIATTVCGMFGIQATTRSPGSTPERPQLRRQNAHLAAELRPGQRLERPGLARMQQRDAPRLLAAQHVLGVVEASRRETTPPRAWSGGPSTRLYGEEASTPK